MKDVDNAARADARTIVTRMGLPSIFIVICWAFQRFCSDSSAAVVALVVAQQGVSSPGIRCSELDVGRSAFNF